ncbi:hypothetical protein BDV98DRAFT_585205 [Pterulicium gracile]|uniref:Homeobox domain-containing protein n=1 Tax=Pterulicium gracile TaxID=1884261 RepID=A0A5C3Q7S0_9AGAR|nr:hypothetical protein BDV98DRAFT_585205 [Pterula gracilis]
MARRFAVTPARQASPSSDSQGGMADTETESPRNDYVHAAGTQPAKKKRTRTLTTPHQSQVLHALLAQSRFPSTAVREEVGRTIGLSARKVQNQRQKAKRPRSQSAQPGSSGPALTITRLSDPSAPGSPVPHGIDASAPFPPLAHPRPSAMVPSSGPLPALSGPGIPGSGSEPTTSPRSSLDFAAPRSSRDFGPRSSLDLAPRSSLDLAPRSSLDLAPRSSLDLAPRSSLDLAPRGHRHTHSTSSRYEPYPADLALSSRRPFSPGPRVQSPPPSAFPLDFTTRRSARRIPHDPSRILPPLVFPPPSHSNRPRSSSASHPRYLQSSPLSTSPSALHRRYEVDTSPVSPVGPRLAPLSVTSPSVPPMQRGREPWTPPGHGRFPSSYEPRDQLLFSSLREPESSSRSGGRYDPVRGVIVPYFSPSPDPYDA